MTYEDLWQHLQGLGFMRPLFEIFMARTDLQGSPELRDESFSGVPPRAALACVTMLYGFPERRSGGPTGNFNV